MECFNCINVFEILKVLCILNFCTFYIYIYIFFSSADQEGNAECDKVLAELEDIDDDAEKHDIDLVKISDPETIEEYNIVTFPTLVFFRKRFPQFYDGNIVIKILPFSLDS